jgi:hypothetical protein
LPDSHHGALPTASLHTTISQHAPRQVYVIKTREYYCFYYVFISYFKARRILDMPCLSVCRLRDAESITLSAGGAETIILSAGGAESMMLSACAESMIVSEPPAASMILSAPFDSEITLLSCYGNSGAAGGKKKTTIGDTDDCQLTTLVTSASTAPPISLLPKIAKICHTSNRFLVGHQRRRALLRLYFNSSVSGQLVGQSVCWLVRWSVGWSVGWSVSQSVICRSVHNKGSRDLGGSGI